jgi:hypothetical protein
VAVYNGINQVVIGDFNAYPTSFTGGVRVAGLDANGDGKWDILTGPGPGSGNGSPFPIPRIFRGNDAGLLDQWAAFDPAFLGGVYVGALRMN